MYTSKQISKKSHHWKIILLFVVAASTLAVKINYFSPKKYQAVAQVKMKEKLSESHPGKLARIKTNPLLKAVTYDAVLKNAVIDGIKNKNLNVAYFQIQPFFRTELYTSAPLMVTYFLKNENFYKQKFDFKYAGDNNFVLRYEVDGITRERAGEFGKEIHETNINFTVSKNTKINPARVEYLLEKNLQFTISSNEAMADNLLKSCVDISTSENASAIISVTSSIPEKSMLIANCISESLSAKSNPYKTLEVINQELIKVSEELEKARKEISGNNQNRFSRPPAMMNDYPKPYENLEAQKKNLEIQSIVMENLSDSLRKNRNNNNTIIDYSSVNDPLITEYITTLNEKITQKNNSAETDVLKLDEEINSLKNTLADVVRNTRKKIALQQDKIYNLLASAIINPGFRVTSAKENIPALQNQNLYLTEKLYNYFVEKRTEAQGALPLTENCLIQKAALPREPANASAIVVWALAIILGLLTGSIAAFILNRFLKPFGANESTSENQNSLSYFASIENGTKKDLSTQFGNLCTKTLLLRAAGEKQIITVTSDSVAEGKTFVATNLAKSLVSFDLNILVIDMNLENPSVEENFETTVNYTLAEVLQKQIGIQEAVQITSIPGLDILRAGNLPYGINTLVATNHIAKILNELKGHYDVIIIDASDVTKSMDAIPCIKFSNSTLFVVKAGTDQKSVLEKTKQIITDFHIENILFVMNNVKLSGKHKRKKIIRQNQEKNQDGASAKVPFLKKVALWFY